MGALGLGEEGSGALREGKWAGDGEMRGPLEKVANEAMAAY